MAIEDAVVFVRQRAGTQCDSTSWTGFSVCVDGQRITRLLYSQDPYVTLQGAVAAPIQLSAVFVGRFLKALFPASIEAQIFRLHRLVYHKPFRSEDLRCFGTHLGSRETASKLIVASLEHLAGPHLEESEALRRFALYEEFQRALFLRALVPVVPTPAEFDKMQIPFTHPGIVASDDPTLLYEMAERMNSKAYRYPPQETIQ